ncbi:MAG TPA: HD domain-containing phosphohydrolase [Bryobacteraceae bacterium]|nr:HD domain-containing phosphohydrolase [Bryobacteraceae bacterium]
MTSRRASIYISLMVGVGAILLGFSLWHWHSQDWVRYLFYCGIALIASGMKVQLPGVTGTLSMNFLFVLIGIAELSQSETMAMGCLGMLVQCVLMTKNRPKPVQVLFSVASVACSIAASYALYHAPLLDQHVLEAPIKLLLAAVAYFITNTFSIALVIALTEGKHAWAVWQDSYFWTFPNYLVGAAVGLVFSFATRAFGWQTSLLLLPILYVIYRSHSLYVNRLEDEKKRAEQQRNHAEEMARVHRRTIEALALAIEAKDQTTHDHLARVEVYATEVGKELGLSNEQLEALQASALLHDIGKLAVPEYIISKPGKLTPEEFEKMKIHPVVGAEILEQVRFPYPVAPIVRSHHEKWDGSGYPDGLAGEQIPIGARILAAVDCLDALASDRQYRRALPLAEAIQVVQSEAGRSFDVRVVEVLARRYVELERMAQTGMHTGLAKLSTEVKIERGAAPAAGFETANWTKDTTDLVNFHNSVAGAQPRAEILAELMQELARCEDQASGFQVMRSRLQRLVPYDVMAIYARHGESLAPECLDGGDYRLFASLEIPLGMGLSGWVAENGKAIVNGNPSVEPGYLNDPTKFSTLRSALAVPLETPAGVVGVLSLYRQERDAFSMEDKELLLSAGAKLAPALGGTAKVLERAG